MKYEAILENSRDFKIVNMCRYLGVKPQNYYRWKRTRQKAAEKRIALQPLIRKIEQVFNDSRKTYGYRTVQRELAKEGITVSEYTVRKIMRENGFYPVTMVKYSPGKADKTEQRYSYNELKQYFKADHPGKKLAGDITYIRTSIGWVYLAVVIDLYNREVVGYETSKQIDSELVKRALANALDKGIKPELFHSDRGSQYSSESFRRMLSENEIRQSQSKPGCPYDNACVESFFATAKKELIYRKKYDIIDEVRKDVTDYIENFYNRKRLHSYLGYMSPVEFRLKNCA